MKEPTPPRYEDFGISKNEYASATNTVFYGIHKYGRDPVISNIFWALFTLLSFGYFSNWFTNFENWFVALFGSFFLAMIPAVIAPSLLGHIEGWIRTE